MATVNPTPPLRSLSVFFPCYNEAENITPQVAEFLELLPRIAKQFEIIVVNDGSSDETGARAEELALQYPKVVRVVHHATNQGYGAALRSGIAASRYDWVFFTDGDHQFYARDLMRFLSHAQSKHAVIGYRFRRAEGWRRRLNAFLFAVYIRLLFGLYFRDIDCAFKLLPGKQLRSLPLSSNGAFISSEMLLQLQLHGVQIHQLPVRHRERRYGKPTGSNWRVIVRALRESSEFFVQHRLTAYSKTGMSAHNERTS